MCAKISDFSLYYTTKNLLGAIFFTCVFSRCACCCRYCNHFFRKKKKMNFLLKKKTKDKKFLEGKWLFLNYCCVFCADSRDITTTTHYKTTRKNTICIAHIYNNDKKKKIGDKKHTRAQSPIDDGPKQTTRDERETDKKCARSLRSLRALRGAHIRTYILMQNMKTTRSERERERGWRLSGCGPRVDDVQNVS